MRRARGRSATRHAEPLKGAAKNIQCVITVARAAASRRFPVMRRRERGRLAGSRRRLADDRAAVAVARKLKFAAEYWPISETLAV